MPFAVLEKAASASDFFPDPASSSCKKVLTHEELIAERLSPPQGW